MAREPCFKYAAIAVRAVDLASRRAQVEKPPHRRSRLSLAAVEYGHCLDV
jgi:hypothetical protein